MAVLTAISAASPSTAQQQTTSQQPSAPATQAMKIDLDELETHPEKYVGKTVIVEGEVDRVLGPHLFTIDERNWKDLERELPVVVPDPFAAIVRSDTPVRVTGTVQKVPIAEIERSRGFLTDAKIKAEIETKPALVATEVTTVAPVAVSLRVRTNQPAPIGTSGTSAPITDVGQLAKSNDKSLVGRRVDVKDAPVVGVSPEGFWVRLPSGERIFVMPTSTTAVREGQTAAVQGVVLELPEGLRVKVNAGEEPIYIYADRVTAR
ncbi:MAG: hypothetical protein EHM55_08065 [Acidobacteria bacterium]|nr:MAG: hypothetical protein EHM55_08065 [Acidobacteriota bacterium]